MENEKFVITFTNNIGYAKGLSILPELAEILKKKSCNVLFEIVGDGRCKEEFVCEREKRNV